MNAVQNIAQAELAKAYQRERGRFDSFIDAIRAIVESDFPAPDGGVATRYDVDAMKGLNGELSALVEGYARHT